MRILVGVMRCIENEFGLCMASLQCQTLRAQDVFVISGLPNKKAHDQLYSTFMERAGEADLFVKLDADMVLDRSTLFEEIAARFLEWPSLDHLQIAVDDFFTGLRIMGLHVYRSSHRWIANDERHFVDLVDEVPGMESDWIDLAPAARHCPDPSRFQCFHFGLHKAVKFLQRSRPHFDFPYSLIHWRYFRTMEERYYSSGDVRLGIAVLGFLQAVCGRYGPDQVDFDCPAVREAFSPIENMDEEGIRLEIRRRWALADRGLPGRLRRLLALVRGRGLCSGTQAFFGRQSAKSAVGAAVCG
jgi:hypothetical protein